MLERAYRRTLAVAPAHDGLLPPAIVVPDSSGDGGVLGQRPRGGGPVPGGSPGACVAHLPWSLPVVAQLLRCLHGLWVPEVQLALGPLKVRGDAGGGESR